MASNKPEIADPHSSARSAVWQHFGYPIEAEMAALSTRPTPFAVCLKKLP